MSSAARHRLNRERGGNLCRTLSHSPQSKMPRDTRFHDCGTHALSFIIDDETKATGRIMNAYANGTMSMLQCISQGFSPNLNDLFANASSQRVLRSIGAVLDSSPPLFRKRLRRKSQRLEYVLPRKCRCTQSGERAP